MDTLYKPTVGQLIAVLQKYPADKPFLIVDPDTGWPIRDFDLEADDTDVFIATEYHRISSNDKY